VVACLVVCTVAAAPFAQAQTVLPPVTPERPAFVPPRSEGLFELPALPAAAAAAADDSAATLVLRVVRVSGQTAVSADELQALARPYLGRPVGPAVLEGLRLQMTRLYVERGYVNSGVLLRRVSADDGVAEFEVVEGRLTEIRLRGMERLHAAEHRPTA
jgi:hemolysin activation/secretion protein